MVCKCSRHIPIYRHPRLFGASRRSSPAFLCSFITAFSPTYLFLISFLLLLPLSWFFAAIPASILLISLRGTTFVLNSCRFSCEMLSLSLFWVSQSAFLHPSSSSPSLSALPACGPWS